MRLTIALPVLLALAGRAGAEEAESYTGKVLPFEIITAVRNYGYKEGMRPAQVAVSVNGGSQADWLATAAFVAEKSIVPDVTFATVEVYIATPWGDLPPTRSKQLAKAYYGGPDPAKSPWPEDPFSIYAVDHAPTMADVEFDELSSKLLEDAPTTADPDKASDAADAKAIVLLRRKYHLARTWKPNAEVGMTGAQTVQVKRSQVTIADMAAADASVVALHECLSRSDDARLFRGCSDRSERYSFQP